MTTTIQNWASRKQTAIEAYQQAIQLAQQADDHLSALLQVKYGKRAGDMRYHPAETVEIQQAMSAYFQASEAQQTAWLAYLGARAQPTIGGMPDPPIDPRD